MVCEMVYLCRAVSVLWLWIKFAKFNGKFDGFKRKFKSNLPQMLVDETRHDSAYTRMHAA